MVRIQVPGAGVLEIEHLVLDVNGTIACDGRMLPGVAEGVAALGERLHIVAITADTHGTASRLRDELGIDVHVISAGGEGAQKRAFVESLGGVNVVAAGNGANDVEMLRASGVGVCVIGPEGAAGAALAAADVVVGDVTALFGLLEHPGRLVATLRR